MSQPLLVVDAVVKRFGAETVLDGVTLEVAVRMARSGRRTGPERRPAPRMRDRRQLSLPIQR